jgi:hypothetical protein
MFFPFSCEVFPLDSAQQSSIFVFDVYIIGQQVRVVINKPIRLIALMN